MIRKDWNDKIFRTDNEKQQAIIENILECNKRGQPVLVFTSVLINRNYQKLLKK